MKIYTKKGDSGTTQLLGGKRVSKSHLRIEAYGTVDELNSHTGLLIDWIDNKNVKTELQKIQNTLFNIGSHLAADKPPKGFTLPEVTNNNVIMLENSIDEMDKSLAPMDSFILPGGHQSVSQSHICRTVCRRAERRIIELSDEQEIDNVLVVYLNRLSDYYFTLARYQSQILDIQDIKWSK